MPGELRAWIGQADGGFAEDAQLAVKLADGEQAGIGDILSAVNVDGHFEAIDFKEHQLLFGL